MKLVSYEIDKRSHLGVLTDEGIINLHQASGGELPDDMLELLELGNSALSTARDLTIRSKPDTPVDSVNLLAPITNPSKVVAIGLNYRDHIRETGLDAPEFPTMFCKYPSAIVGDGDAIRWSSSLTRQVDYEAELAVVIGKPTRRVSAVNALDHVAGYTNCNDISARDLQFRTGDQWLRGKCLDSFCPLGPYLVTRDEIPDPHALQIQCRINDEVRQNSSTAELLCKIPELIEYLSEAFTLLPGDIIATGTPHGVGAFRDPPVWLQHGDKIEVEIGGLGCLHNTCIVE